MAKVLSIRALHAQGWSLRRIARVLAIHRETVAPAPTAPDDPRPAKAPPGSDGGDDGSKLAKAPTWSRSLCEPFRESTFRKFEHRLSAQRIFQDLLLLF